jgi:biotin-(acetyl-CoA carboxylase) ligase
VQRGVFRDLDSDGALVMEAGGRRQTVATGDIFFTAA